MGDWTEQYQERCNGGDRFVSKERSFRVQSMAQDSDCWSDLWQSIKAKGSRFLGQKE